MKAFLLSAGHGTRLWPLTDVIPKCLVSVRGVPMLQIWFDICHEFGIDELLINLHAHANQVREFLRRNSNGIRVRIFEEPVLLGSAGTLRKNREWIGLDPCFWVLYGDVLTTANLSRMLEFHQQHGQAATMGVCEVAQPSRCGIVGTDEQGIVRSFVEKPQVPTSNLAFSGLLVATPQLLDVIPDKVPADIAFDVLPQLVGRMAAYHISNYLIDIGTPETYSAAQQSWPGVSQSYK